MDTFNQAFARVIGHEGGLSVNPTDPGNWTGSPIGTGQCRGTKYGISAHSYPDCDILNLSLEQAQSIYRHDFWDRIGADDLPGPLALLVFDAAVNNGVGRALQWLEAARKQTADSTGAELCAEFQTQRMIFMAALPTWKRFGLGWARRLCRLPYESLTIQ